MCRLTTKYGSYWFKKKHFLFQYACKINQNHVSEGVSWLISLGCFWQACLNVCPTSNFPKLLRRLATSRRSSPLFRRLRGAATPLGRVDSGSGSSSTKCSSNPLAFRVTVPSAEGRRTAARPGTPVKPSARFERHPCRGQWHWPTEAGIHENNAKMTVDFEECIKDSPRFRWGCLWRAHHGGARLLLRMISFFLPRPTTTSSLYTRRVWTSPLMQN